MFYDQLADSQRSHPTEVIFADVGSVAPDCCLMTTGEASITSQIKYPMQPEINVISESKLIGRRLTMSLEDHKVADLWKSFMQRRNEITHSISDNLISLTIYQPGHFLNFRTSNEFEKWAAIEVSSFEDLPKDLETFVLTSGLYAIFKYKGLDTDYGIYQYIFQSWLPVSDYTLDDRPHFEILGAKFKKNDPESEEEIYIPIKVKTEAKALDLTVTTQTAGNPYK